MEPDSQNALIEAGFAPSVLHRGDKQLQVFVRQPSNQGAGTKTLVLLHGAAGNAASWLPIERHLANHRTILVDLPGHGQTPALDDWSLEVLADLLLEAIDDPRLSPFIWGGHSWGGKTAAVLAARHPDRVAALVLVDPSPASPVPISPDAFVDGLLAGEHGRWPTLADALTQISALPHYRCWSPALEAHLLRGLRYDSQEGLRSIATRDALKAVAAAALNCDHSPTIQKVRCPTLLLMASESMFWQEPTNVAALAQATKLTLEGQHWIHWEQPDRVGDALAGWLETIPGQA